MKVLVVGAGPGGLSFATLLARSAPEHDITVIERDREGADPGWGVTIRDYALGFVGLDSALPMQKLRGRACWYDGEVAVDLPYPPTDGLHTVARSELQRALADGCVRAGARIAYEKDARSLSAADLDEYDLVVAADGRNSAVRALYADAFSPTVDLGRNRYVWLAAEKPFDTLTILLEDGAHPFLAWAYKYTETMSTFIVETTADVLADAGLAELSDDELCAAVARSFERELGGAAVRHLGDVRWEPFPMISCKRIRYGNVVLLGDSAHTTHFSQGFGTMFAFDDATALHDAILAGGSLDEALERYEAEQQPKIENFQSLSATSMRWSEATVDALSRRDPAGVRAQIEARWPGNVMPEAPMRSLASDDGA